MRLKHYITTLLLVVAISFAPVILHAQTEEGDGQEWNDPDAPTDVPFDGGVSLLVAAGVAYGLKKKHDAKKQLDEK